MNPSTRVAYRELEIEQSRVGREGRRERESTEAHATSSTWLLASKSGWFPVAWARREATRGFCLGGEGDKQRE